MKKRNVRNLAIALCLSVTALTACGGTDTKTTPAATDIATEATDVTEATDTADASESPAETDASKSSDAENTLDSAIDDKESAASENEAPLPKKSTASKTGPEAAPAAAPAADTVSTIVGVVDDATMNSVTIVTDEGDVLSFAIPEEADKSELEEMVIDKTIEISYTGEIDDEGAANVVVTKIADATE